MLITDEENANSFNIKIESVDAVVNVPLYTDVKDIGECDSTDRTEVIVTPECNETATVICKVPKVNRAKVKTNNLTGSAIQVNTQSANLMEASTIVESEEGVSTLSLPHVIRVQTFTNAATTPDSQLPQLETSDAVSLEPDPKPNQEVLATGSMPCVEEIKKEQPEDCESACSDVCDEAVEVGRGDNENVLVQHYLLTSIITNTPSGQQTSQLITTPIVLPDAATHVSPDEVTTVPIQLIGNAIMSSDEGDSIEGDNLQASTENETYNSVPVIEKVHDKDSSTNVKNGGQSISEEGELVLAGAARCVPLYNNSSPRITFSEQPADEESMHDKTSHTMELIQVLESMIEDENDVSTESASLPDPHCRDRCSDYTDFGDTDKEYVLINPVSDDFQFQDDLETSLPGVNKECDSENADMLSSLSMAASQELSDALSGL